MKLKMRWKVKPPIFFWGWGRGEGGMVSVFFFGGGGGCCWFFWCFVVVVVVVVVVVQFIKGIPTFD